MRRISSNSVGIQQGTRLLFSHHVDNGPMWSGAGDRELRVTITFPEAFADTPSVHACIGMCDMDHKTNMRTDLSVIDITPTQFTVLFRTWGDTRIARIRADWLAVGPAIDPDDWQLY